MASRMRTTPGGSPLGETSQLPSASAVANKEEWRVVDEFHHHRGHVRGVLLEDELIRRAIDLVHLFKGGDVELAQRFD